MGKLTNKGLENFVRINAALRGQNFDTPGEEFVGDLYKEAVEIGGGSDPYNHIGRRVGRRKNNVSSIA